MNGDLEELLAGSTVGELRTKPSRTYRLLKGWRCRESPLSWSCSYWDSRPRLVLHEDVFSRESPSYRAAFAKGRIAARNGWDRCRNPHSRNWHRKVGWREGHQFESNVMMRETTPNTAEPMTTEQMAAWGA